MLPVDDVSVLEPDTVLPLEDVREFLEPDTTLELLHTTVRCGHVVTWSRPLGQREQSDAPLLLLPLTTLWQDKTAGLMALFFPVKNAMSFLNS